MLWHPACTGRSFVMEGVNEEFPDQRQSKPWMADDEAIAADHPADIRLQLMCCSGTVFGHGDR